MKKELITHTSFSKLMVDGNCVARINKMVDGNWMLISNDDYSNAITTTAEAAVNWMTAQCLAVALSV